MESVLDYSQNLEPNLKEQNKKQNNYKTQKNNPLVDFIYPVSWGISDYGISERGLDFLTLGLESKNLFGTLMFNGGHKIDIRDKKHENYFGISLKIHTRHHLELYMVPQLSQLLGRRLHL